MPQSMLALLAMTVVMLSSHSQHSSRLASYSAMIEDEYELMANSIAIEQIEIITTGTVFSSLESWDGTVTTRSVSLPSINEPFILTITVDYVNSSGNAVIGPTSKKMVVVSVTHDNYNRPLVTHTRLIGN